MSFDLVEVAILRRLFQVEPKPERYGVRVTPPACDSGHDVHYIRITPDFDEMVRVDFITKRGNDVMAYGGFEDGCLYICDEPVFGWDSINALVKTLAKARR
ncbi:hypothetical protein OD808_02110 [Aeromonas veronii]|uniref:hypothetical protein n=1 Tax=Aeromonas veronii TaxID=654 RepID=UPI002245F2B1|nr:hypothetical protein [Aeromonas veronii]EKP0300219.1 hypothetical protein [Aeromonas veronii]MCX0429667.1 hypothetical protein [Aeromonas veronii]